MTDHFPVSIVIPAYNEEAGLPVVLAAISELAESDGLEVEVIVVDDGSTDGTAREARGEGVRLLSHDRNRGYGASLKSGIQVASHERIVIIDADGTYPVEVIPDLLEQLEMADMAVAARSAASANIPAMRRPAKWFLQRLAEFVTGEPIPDLNSGLRAFRRGLVRHYLPLISERFSFTTTLTIAALCDGLTIRYIDIDYRPRIGESKIVARDFFGFLSLVTRLSILFRPLRVFCPPAVVFGGLGLAKLMLDVVVGLFRSGLDVFVTGTVSTSAVILLLVAVQLVLVGMLFEALARYAAGRLPADYRPVGLMTSEPARSERNPPEDLSDDIPFVN